MLRLPRLAEQLGPVKGLSRRVASRIVNTIRMGYPVGNWEELQKCRLILVLAPDALPTIVAEMAASRLDWTGKVVVACDTMLDSSELAGLTRLGAAVASLKLVDGSEGRRFVAEGDRAAIRELRRLIEDDRMRVHAIKPGKKALYLAGLTFATSFLTPLMAAGVDCLRRSGIRATLAPVLAEKILQRSVRAYMKAGKKGWTGPVAPGDERAFASQLEAVGKISPLLASYYRENLRFAREILGRTRKRPSRR